ncbi:MAG: hypothetical protein ACPGVU_09695 [Limisphaerales bacterium]
MKTQRIISIGSTLAAVTFLTLWINERNHRYEPSSEKAPIRELLRHVQQVEHHHAVQRADLEEKLHQTAAMLNEVGIDLQEKQKQIKDLRFGQQAREFISDVEAMLLAGIAGPTNSFARVISPSGEVHFEKAMFSSESGGRLFFKTPRFRKGLDVTQIHPVIIRALKRDPLKLVKALQNARQQRSVKRLETLDAVEKGREETMRIMREKIASQKAEEAVRAQQQLEREELQMQQNLAQQQLMESARRNRANEQLRQQQLQLERYRTDVEAYQLYLQGQRGNTMYVVPTRSVRNTL